MSENDKTGNAYHQVHCLVQSSSFFHLIAMDIDDFRSHHSIAMHVLSNNFSSIYKTGIRSFRRLGGSWFWPTVAITIGFVTIFGSIYTILYVYSWTVLYFTTKVWWKLSPIMWTPGYSLFQLWCNFGKTKEWWGYGCLMGITLSGQWISYDHIFYFIVAVWRW